MDSIKSVRVDERVVHEGKWLRMKNIDFKVGEKQLNNYESVERTTRKKDTGFDGVDVVALIRKKEWSSKKIIIIANYRPPIDAFILEFPAGLMDDSDLVANALRELKEETGYVGEYTGGIQSPIIYGDPWKSNENGRILVVDVDGDREENQNVKQELESSENIRVLLLDFNSNLVNQLEELHRTKNYQIETKVWTFALGLHLQSKF